MHIGHAHGRRKRDQYISFWGQVNAFQMLRGVSCTPFCKPPYPWLFSVCYSQHLSLVSLSQWEDGLKPLWTVASATPLHPSLSLNLACSRAALRTSPRRKLWAQTVKMMRLSSCSWTPQNGRLVWFSWHLDPICHCFISAILYPCWTCHVWSNCQGLQAKITKTCLKT